MNASIPTLVVGAFLKAEGFDRAYPLQGAKSYCGEAVFDRAVANGQETAWCVNPGYSIVSHDNSKELAAERAAFANATTVKTGDVFIIEGVPQRCKVNGPKFSDPIVFLPI